MSQPGRVGARILTTTVLCSACTACIYSVPLGGIAVGRGQPLGDRVIQVGLSGGRMPELAGTLPDAGVNPIPPRDSLTTSMGGLDLFAVGVGFSESVDVGYSFSRGLHSVIRLKQGDIWSVSISPAYYRYSYSSSEPTSRVSNLNLTGLLSLDPWPERRFIANAYAGLAVNRYSAEIDTGLVSRGHAAFVPTALLGLRLGLPRCLPFCRAGDPRFATLGVEGQSTWIRQRDGRQDLVPTLRVFLSLSTRVPERRRRPGLAPGRP